MTPQFLTLPDGRLAYQRLVGEKNSPGIVFLGGFASDMTGTKATYLAERCAAAKISFLRFDYRGNGQSSGDFKDYTIGSWFADTCAVLDQLTEGPQIIVGSSMGGWLGLKLTLQRPERVKALIGIAAAPDFTEDLLWAQLKPEQRSAVERDGFIHDGHAPITLKLIEEARQHLLLRAKINVTCPVRLLQGMKDDAVPWQHALRISENITHGDVQANLIKDGDHRLSRDQDLEVLWRTVEEFLPP